MRRQLLQRLAIATLVITTTTLLATATIGAAPPRTSPKSPAGATDPGVTQATLASTICATGVTGELPGIGKKLRARVFAAHHVRTGAQKRWAVTTLVPVELGGAVRPDNLVLVRKVDVAARQAVVTEAHDDVCSGQLDLAPAQAAFVRGWKTTHAEVAQLVDRRRAEVATFIAETQRAEQEKALAEYLASIAPPPTTAPAPVEGPAASSGPSPSDYTCQLKGTCPAPVHIDATCAHYGATGVTPEGVRVVCKIVGFLKWVAY